MDKDENQVIDIPVEAIDFFSQGDFFWVTPEGSLGGYLNGELKLCFTHTAVKYFNEEGVKTNIQEAIRKANQIKRWMVMYYPPLDRDITKLKNYIEEHHNPSAYLTK